MKEIKENGLKIIIFFLVGFILFESFSNIFVPKRFSYNKVYDAGKFKGYEREKSNDIDVLICGTSHASHGILPMELYEKYGIRSYNLGTSWQPIEATYYMLLEALHKQNPKIIIIDVSALYLTDYNEAAWNFVLDDLPFGGNKFKLEECMRHTDQENMHEGLIPFLKYHDRWKELKEEDFRDMLHISRHDYNKGGHISSITVKSNLSVEVMNAIADELQQNIEISEWEYKEGKDYKVPSKEMPYAVDVTEEKIEWLQKIKELCDEKNIQCLLVKVPVLAWPQLYSSAWSEAKYHTVKEISDKYDIVYYDFLYEAGLNLDYDRDSHDGGMHLNLSGAQKVSENLGKYLKEHYELPDERNEQWDRDLIIYKDVRNVAQLQLEQDFSKYIDFLSNNYKDKTILITASLDYMGLKDYGETLRKLGIKADFNSQFHDAYVAVVEDGVVKYEALSGDKLSYEGVCDISREKYRLYSSGWRTSAGATITIANRELANSFRGLNIVVYDNRKNLVLDSVCYDEQNNAIRNGDLIDSFMEGYERYMVEMED